MGIGAQHLQLFWGAYLKIPHHRDIVDGVSCFTFNPGLEKEYVWRSVDARQKVRW